MISRGIIKKITENDIFAEIIGLDSVHEKPSCTSGGCAGCSQNKKRRILKVANPRNVSLSAGSIVELRLSSLKVIRAALRFFLFLPVLFALGFHIAGTVLNGGEGVKIMAGFLCLLLGFSFIFINRKKSKVSEMPEIISVI